MISIIHYIHWIFGLIIIVIHGFFKDKFILDSYIIMIYFLSVIPFLANFLSRAKIFGTEFDFKEKIKSVEDIRNQEFIKNEENKKFFSITTTRKYESTRNINEIASYDHVLALAKLRIEIEKRLKNIIERREIAYPGRTFTALRYLNLLLENKIINKKQNEYIKKILAMCNKAIHGYKLTKLEAYRIIDLSTEIFILFSRIEKNIDWIYQNYNKYYSFLFPESFLNK